MRRLLPLLAVVALAGALFASPARGDTAQPQGPVAVPPGAVALIQDVPDHPGLPQHFRMATDPFPADAQGPLPSRTGLDSLRMSGSAQFSAAQLQAVAETVGGPIVVVDLRQESHGFLNGLPVSWYAMHDQVNVVRSLVEVQQDERQRLEALAAAGQATTLVVRSKSAAGTISEADPVTVAARPALTERELAHPLGLGYFRIPATDFLPPTAENVDRFVAFATALPPETWLHFHCHGGDGRTTTFMAIWDMMHNAGTVSLDDIVQRQALIGTVDLFKVTTPESWTYPFQLARAAFVRHFYAYARESAATGFVVPWSVWSASRPFPLDVPLGDS
jgi:hypothetical protein